MYPFGRLEPSNRRGLDGRNRRYPAVRDRRDRRATSTRLRRFGSGGRQRTLALLLSDVAALFDFGAPVLLPSMQGRLLGRQRSDHLAACTLTRQQDSVNFVLGVLCRLAEEPQCLLHITHRSRLWLG